MPLEPSACASANINGTGAGGVGGNDGCNETAVCVWWDAAVGNWSHVGCTSSTQDGVLVCNCTHLTDFCGLYLPTTAEELNAELAALDFSAPCAEGWTAAASFDEANAMYTYTCMCMY